MIFAILTLVSALSISCIAAYFSIIGLATIFPGSIAAVIAMGSALEVGKIIAAIWLHKNWKSAPKMIKIYLFSAIVVLMGITSMGIFGFLSKSHIEHEQDSLKAQALVQQVETKISRQQDYISRQKELIAQNEYKNQNLSDKSSDNIELEQKKISQLTEQLEKDIALDSKMLEPIQARINQLNQELNEVKNGAGGLFSNKKKKIEDKVVEQAAEREELKVKKQEIELRISEYRNETSAIISNIRKRIQEYQTIGFEKPEDTELKIEELNNNISEALDIIDNLEREKFDLDDGSRQLEAEVGPIKYVAELIADFRGMQFDMGKAVRIVIIILIFVFDPLAILLVLAAHISLSKRFPKAMQDEVVVFEKSTEIELKIKELDRQQIDLEERQKDIDQENKILSLKENQVQKYQEEVSVAKEELRKIKIECQQEILKKEDSSIVSKEIEDLMRQKNIAENDVKEIKIKKAKLLDKADEAAKNVSEIKEIMINHKSETNQIDKLKSEICVSTNILSEIKNQVSSLEQEKEDLYIKNINLEKQLSNKSEEAKINPNTELENKISELTSQKNQLLKENIEIKNRKISIITCSILPNGRYSLEVPCKHSGYHCFERLNNFTKEDIYKFSDISDKIDLADIGKDQSIKESIFNSMIKNLIDQHVDNRTYHNIKPKYKYKA